MQCQRLSCLLLCIYFVDSGGPRRHCFLDEHRTDSQRLPEWKQLNPLLPTVFEGICFCSHTHETFFLFIVPLVLSLKPGEARTPCLSLLSILHPSPYLKQTTIQTVPGLTSYFTNKVLLTDSHAPFCIIHGHLGATIAQQDNFSRDLKEYVINTLLPPRAETVIYKSTVL